ncbi:ATP-binding protein [Amycolatopsis regifaucium]|uniref:ATP-binding protein n=1 Tax=Amycolatopsis regifaucium TaxID=546365 RepID=A0A154M447_9PSEU|nr:ATP-binding protein [Amycolatopsis regifaucium]KZB79147.1 protein phosphatase [Amycolatopsis regifaucium]OKA07331.1 ATP-binding protein [Amycolatopsis regifaucium]SFH14156.1 Histidine kinase-like ATPase domain-containing protein [Amycolatopsis regifaucium]
MGTTNAYEFLGGGTPPLGKIRAWLRDQLAGLGLTTVSDTELLTTELVTNAHEHADGAAELRVSVPAGRDVVRVEVDDHRPQLKPRRVAKKDPTSAHGRGLALVEAISANWGVDTGAGVKTVWVEIPVP